MLSLRLFMETADRLGPPSSSVRQATPNRIARTLPPHQQPPRYSLKVLRTRAKLSSQQTVKTCSPASETGGHSASRCWNSVLEGDSRQTRDYQTLTPKPTVDNYTKIIGRLCKCPPLVNTPPAASSGHPQAIIIQESCCLLFAHSRREQKAGQQLELGGPPGDMPFSHLR